MRLKKLTKPYFSTKTTHTMRTTTWRKTKPKRKTNATKTRTTTATTSNNQPQTHEDLRPKIPCSHSPNDKPIKKPVQSPSQNMIIFQGLLASHRRTTSSSLLLKRRYVHNFFFTFVMQLTLEKARCEQKVVVYVMHKWAVNQHQYEGVVSVFAVPNLRGRVYIETTDTLQAFEVLKNST